MISINKKLSPFLSDEESHTPVVIPEKIGPYKIDSLLDRGGMSILYLSTHPETKIPIAIKVLEPKFLSRPEVVQRFVQETQIVGLPSHPNIVKLFSHGEWEGGLYIAMEFIQGISLRQLLLKSHISLRRALEIVIEISYALCHLHTHGIIHRDLKPENVLITTRENQSNRLWHRPAAHRTARSKSAGQAAYYRNAHLYESRNSGKIPISVSYPSDIYSLGIITYELAIGKLSYGQIHLGLVPKGLKPILHKALQQNPADRYQDMVDFITDMTSIWNRKLLPKRPNQAIRSATYRSDLSGLEASLHPEIPDWPDIEIG